MLVAQDVEVSVASGVQILAPVSLDVAPGSLVALMGASGSGKSTLLRVLAGIDPPTGGSAHWEKLSTLDAVHLLGYVPQRESVQDRLTPREALQYAATLRLDRETANAERVESVLSELDLLGQGDTLIRNLSGGERRRTACGLELIGDPRLLLLDEPTSGLDIVLERRLMQLFRRLADHGRAVLVATHATASLDLCDEVVILRKGAPVHRSPPAEARMHLEAAVLDTETVQVADPEAAARPRSVATPPTDRPFGHEFRAFVGRYYRTLTRDRRTLQLQFVQAPVIGLLIAIVFHPGALDAGGTPNNAIELVFMLMTGSIWLGVAAASREVVKERGLVEREFDVGARLDAYVLSKAAVLFAQTFLQVILLVAVIVALQPLHVQPSSVVEVFALAVLTAWVSVAMGLAVSCVARTVDQAAGSVPLLLIPQLLFAGALVPLAQMPRIVQGIAVITYARWSYAGLGSAAQLGNRLNSNPDASALGFGSSFFMITPGTAAGVLVVFIVVLLLLAVLLISKRPEPENP